MTGGDRWPSRPPIPARPRGLRSSDFAPVRPPLPGLTDEQWSDRDMVRALIYAGIAAAAVLFWVGMAVTGVYLWHHWRAAVKPLYCATAAAYLLHLMPPNGSSA